MSAVTLSAVINRVQAAEAAETLERRLAKASHKDPTLRLMRGMQLKHNWSERETMIYSVLALLDRAEHAESMAATRVLSRLL